MKFKKMLAMLLSLCMILSLAACGSKEEPAPEKEESKVETSDPGEEKPTYTITIAASYQDGHYTVQGYEAFKEYVEKESDGRIKVDIFANGTLATGDPDSMEYTSSGSCTMANSDLTMIGSFITDNRWESTSIPYYYGSDLDVVYDVIDNSEAWAECKETLAEKGGMVLLGCVNGGIAVVGSDVPLNGMDDFAGKKYRTATSDPYLKPVDGWGASAISMDFSEIYTSVQNKTINGTFTSLSAIYTQGLTDVMKYMVRVDAFNLMFGFLMNADFYNSLDDEARAIVDAGAAVMNEVARTAEKEFSADLDKNLEGVGVTQIYPEGEWAAELESSLEGYINDRRAALDADWLAKLDKALA